MNKEPYRLDPGSYSLFAGSLPCQKGQVTWLDCPGDLARLPAGEGNRRAADRIH